MPAWRWQPGLGAPGAGGLSLAGKPASVLARAPGPSPLLTACCGLTSPSVCGIHPLLLGCLRQSYLVAARGWSRSDSPRPGSPHPALSCPHSFLPPLAASDLSTSLPSILWALLCLQLSFLLPLPVCLLSLPRAWGMGGCPKAELTPPPTHQLEHVLPKVEA